MGWLLAPKSWTGAPPDTHTVEPLNNGQIGMDHFVHDREVKMYCHYIGWCIGKCPLYRGVLYSECIYQRFHNCHFRVYIGIQHFMCFLSVGITAMCVTV